MVKGAPIEQGADSRYKHNADQLGMEVIGMLWEVGMGRFC